MSKTVSDFIIERMYEWGVNRVFGYPGDGINGVMGALRRAQDKIDFIQVSHEENAAFMACAHAKFTGEVGVCISTSGPGAIHMLNGLYDAKLDHQPVVAILGQQARMSMGGECQQEVDLVSLFKDVAHNYVHMVTDPNQVRHVIDRAIRIAKAERTVTCVILPNDVQELAAVKEPPHTHGSVHTGIGFSVEKPVPPQSELQKAAIVLNEGKKVAILAGVGAAGAPEELKEIAELLGAGIAKALLGRAILPDDLPYSTGAIGLLGTNASWELMSECDTLLMIGTGFPYSEYLPKEGQARAVQIDIDPKMVSLRYPTEVNLIGDSQATLKALVPLIIRKEDRSWREKIEKDVADWNKVVEAKAEVTANPLNPQKVVQELSSRLPDRCIITADSGSSAGFFARNLKLREGMMASLSGTLATMCPAIPYITAAKFAYPDRVPIAIIGDGAMQMLGINGLITIAKYRNRWRDQRMVILVLNNRDLNFVSWEQRVTSGDPEFSGSQDIIDFAYAKYAELLGLKGIKIDKVEEIGPAWDAALAADRPCVIEAMVDPSVPPLPPHITADQMIKFTEALLKGDAKEFSLIKQTFKDMLQEVLH
ncbi:thiamine pyrophosphate-requiring protein [Mucilaginibacter sp.]